ncbi:hypothetical protein [Nocardia sp. SYP-A9097]|uniref:hypothetical protein n=1 Tax=Nocardia sp. SYP-A9097 TaxID=2663237 RepID=UPI00129BEBB0|nr:hypothetical protein [Nocardia sp. SYP-A9097]
MQPNGIACATIAELETDREILRAAALEQQAKPVGYLAAHRDALAQWWAQEQLWATRDGAEADMLDMANALPGADCRVLTCFDDSPEPYRAGRPEASDR